MKDRGRESPMVGQQIVWAHGQTKISVPHLEGPLTYVILFSCLYGFLFLFPLLLSCFFNIAFILHPNTEKETETVRGKTLKALLGSFLSRSHVFLFINAYSSRAFTEARSLFCLF